MTFSGLSIDSVGSFTIAATTTGLTQVITSVINVTPGTATQLVISPANEPPSTTGAGNQFGFIVDAEDAYYNIDPTFVGSVGIALVNSGGVMLHGASMVNGKSGVATFSNLSIDMAGTYQIAATSNGLSGVTTTNVAVSAGPVAKLGFIENPTNTTAGAAMSPAVTVGVEDSYGNVIGTNNSTVTLTLSSGTFEGGSNTTTATAMNGVAVQQSEDRRRGQLYVVGDRWKSHGLGSKPELLELTAAGANKLAFRQQPTSAIAGSAINPPVSVNVEDMYGNVVMGDSSTVTLTLNTGTLKGGSATVSTGAMSGVATFPNLKIDTAGTSYTFSATDGMLAATGPSNSFAITAAAASKVVVGQQPTNTVAGSGISPSVTVDVEDANNNLVTTDQSIVTLTLSSGTFAGGSKTATAKAVGGIATFSNLIINATGTYTLSATDGMLAGSGSSNSFTITDTGAAGC